MEQQLSYEERRKILISYLLMKAQEEDWHAVADAAMDLREMEAAHQAEEAERERP